MANTEKMGLSHEKGYDLYQRLYFWEIERQDRINSRLPVILVIILTLAGLQSYMMEHLLPLSKEVPEVVAGILLLISMICLVVAAVYVKLAWLGHAYAYMPPADRLENHRKELREFCHDEAKPEGEIRDLSTEFEADLSEYFIENGSCNYRLNKKKSLRFHVAFNWILGSIASSVASFIVVSLKNGIWKI